MVKYNDYLVDAETGEVIDHANDEEVKQAIAKEAIGNNAKTMLVYVHGNYRICKVQLDPRRQTSETKEGHSFTILNTSILTSYGDYSYLECSLDAARKLVTDGYQSAVGHQATADILTDLLGVPVTMNRIEYRQQPGERALIFKLNGRAPEGVILSREEVEKMGYTFGVLTRHA